MANETMYWNDLRGKPINVAGQGRQAGIVEDFYYEPGTQSVNALRIQAGLRGYCILLASAIASIDENGITIDNENMLINEANAGPIYQLPLGHRLIGFRIVTEQGNDVGTVRNILLGIYPPVALRISAFELNDRRGTLLSAHALTRIGEDSLTVMGQNSPV